MDKKEVILNNVSMINVLDKYNIKHNHRMFSCPFHGKDNHFSAKFYINTFYCFCCHAHGDIIQFVQDYFGISFNEAMEKINQDFNLGLKRNSMIDIRKINDQKKERYIQKEKEIKLNKEYQLKCDIRHSFVKEIDFLNSIINIRNCDFIMTKIMKFQSLINNLDIQLDYLDNQIYELKYKKIS